MTTAVAISVYAAFALYRAWRERNDRQRAKTADALRDAEAGRIKARLTAIEEALRSSPFVTFTKTP